MTTEITERNSTHYSEQFTPKGQKPEDNPINNSHDSKDKAGSVSLLQLFRYADKVDAILLILGMTSALASGVTQALQIVVFGDVLNAFNGSGTDYDVSSAVTKVAIRFIWIAIASLVFGYGQVSLFSYSSTRQTKRLREAYIAAILRKEIEWFDINNPGQLATKISEETLIMQNGMGRKAGDGLMFFGLFCSGMIIGLAKGWQLALVLMCFIPVIAVTAYIMMKVISTAVNAQTSEYAKAGSLTQEALRNIRTVFAFNATKALSVKYDALLIDTEKCGIKKGTAVGGATAMMFMSVFCAYAVGMYYGAVLVSNDTLECAADNTCCTGDACYSGGRVITVFFAVIMAAMALGQAGPSVQAIISAQSVAFNIYKLIDAPVLIDSMSSEGKQLQNVEGYINISKVKFNYPSRPDVPLYKDFTLSITKGEKIALVGASGCGKSTIIQLLERFYDPMSGSIELDGHDIRTLNLVWYRQQIGLVGQEPILFSCSIAENIAHGKKGASREEVEEAARMANAYDFIMSFPDGFETDVGEKGGQLSGGQKQRIAIARAMIKDPAVLLLDEATSALDTESERVVQESLDRLLKLKKRTTIIIAHRLSTIQDADRIAVISEGSVVEMGSHEVLLKIPDGHYQHLVRMQTQTANDDIKKTSSKRLTIASLNASSEKMLMADMKSEQKLIKGNEIEGETKEVDVSNGKKNRIWALNKPEWKFLLLGGIGAAITGAVFPVWGVLLSEVMTLYFRTSDTKHEMRMSALKWSGAFIALGLSFGVGNLFQGYGFAVASERLTRRLRSSGFSAILRQEIGWFDQEENTSGALVSQLAADTACIKAVTAEFLNTNILTICTLTVGIVIAFYNNWKMTLVMLSMLPLMGIGFYVQAKLMNGTNSDKSLNDSDRKASALITEAISSIRTVASYNMEIPLKQAYSTLLNQSNTQDIRSSQLSGLGFGFSQSLIFFTNALIFWYGGTLVSKGEATFQQVMMVILAIMMSSFGLGVAGQNITDAQQAKKAISNIFQLLDRQPLIDVDLPGEEIKNVEGHIQFKSVVFAYPSRPNATIYDGYTLDIASGETVALVGASGGGKSTAVALIERFYDPLEGTIYLDGKDIKTLSLYWLRNNVSLVSQEPALFSGTIAENIALGKPDSTRKEIEEAAKMANAHNFITLFPDGYDTELGENGLQVSGGQKQRIAIARAIIRDPKVLILDEATSALDTESEAIVQQSLDSLLSSKKRTTIVIAHRLSTIRNADKIVVVFGGKVVEQGRHEDLLNIPNGHYAQLISRQHA